MVSSCYKAKSFLAGFCWFLLLFPAQSAELIFADYNSQGLFNNFSGDSGAFAKGAAEISGVCDTDVFHGEHGASLRIDYSVKSGFCGIWNSLLGKISHPQYALNFTNLYGDLRNSTGNPARVESIRVTNFSFWARGNGKGDFIHKIKVEFKSSHGFVGNTVVPVSNSTQWTKYSFPLTQLGPVDLSQMKELVLVVEDWQNGNRAGTVYLDDLSFGTDEAAFDPLRWGDDVMLDVVSHRAFSYFLRFTDDLGFALDRSTFSDMVSVGTIGFQLTSYCIGHKRGWADKTELENRVVKVLQNLKNVPMGSEPGTASGGYRGFYYHFLLANSGRRKDEAVELSLYDTMLLMYGVLSCKEYFPANAQIQSLSQELFDRVDWDWFVDHNRGTNRNQFYLAWKPRPQSEGIFYGHVDGQTDEALMVDILALGSRTHPISLETHLARNRVFSFFPPEDKTPIMVSWNGSLFNYFFASCWLNYQSRGLDLHPRNSENIWLNNRRAILANREFCIQHASPSPNAGGDHYATYGEASWGLTACENLVEPGHNAAGEYFSFGALPTEENVRFGTKAPHSGTIAVYGAASCINFTPVESIAALRHYFEIPRLWNPLFGFGDAFSLDPHYAGPPYDALGNPTIEFAARMNGPWINPMAMGVNVGPMLLAIENYRSHQIWDLAARNPEISTGLDRIFGVGTPETVSVSLDQSGHRKQVSLKWNAQPGAAEYSVFASPDLESWSLLQEGIKNTDWTDFLSKGIQRFYRIKAIK
jgi:hypothetical protein